MADPAVKKAGLAAQETAIQSIMPQLQETLSHIRSEIRDLNTRILQLEQRMDARIDQLEERMNERFDQTRDVINELGQRITKVEGKLEAYTEISREPIADVSNLIERAVRVEMLQAPEKRRAS